MIRLFLLALSALVLVACASVLGPRTVDISRDELQASLARQFPLHRPLGPWLDVEVGVPRLTLRPQTDRIAAQLDLTAVERLLGGRHHGSLALSFGLRYQAQDHTLRLSDVKVETLQLDGLPPLAQGALSKWGAWLAENALQDHPIHHFNADDLRTADRLGYAVEDIHVTAQGLSVHLSPRR